MEDIIINYIVSIAPAVTAILTAVGTMVLAYKKIKIATQDANIQTKALQRDVSSVMKENAELKRELRRTLRMVHRVRGDDDDTSK